MLSHQLAICCLNIKLVAQIPDIGFALAYRTKALDIIYKYAVMHFASKVKPNMRKLENRN